MNIVGIDPGKKGAIVLFKGSAICYWEMPLTSDDEIDYIGLQVIVERLHDLEDDSHIFLERAMPMAMGSKHAFNYGRGFAAIEIAILRSKIPVTYVEPMKWSKVIHDGISKDLKPKAKSKIALERLFPKYLHALPKSKKGEYHEGIMEGILIAEYGRRLMK